MTATALSTAVASANPDPDSTPNEPLRRQLCRWRGHPLQLDLENVDLDNTTQDGNHGNEGPAEGESPTQYLDVGTDNTNIVPAGPLGNTADDVTVTPITAPGTIPACDIPAFGPAA
jgi:hypothetical protein